MNKENQRQTHFINVGSSLLLVVFLALCLSTFAALSLSTAHSDVTFSRQMADRKTEYFEACNRAEEVLAQLDPVLKTAADSAGRNESWPAKIDLSGIDPSVTQNLSGDIELNTVTSTLSYQVPVNDRQLLEVSLSLNTGDKAAENGFYRIQTWQVKDSSEWESDQTLQLLPMQN